MAYVTACATYSATLGWAIFVEQFRYKLYRNSIEFTKNSHQYTSLDRKENRNSDYAAANSNNQHSQSPVSAQTTVVPPGNLENRYTTLPKVRIFSAGTTLAVADASKEVLKINYDSAAIFRSAAAVGVRVHVLVYMRDLTYTPFEGLSSLRA
ncbi:MAG: hypothetical protein GY696_14980 [Gammaproteobacteria bacterium]|nr:hypothetical protein [Gammaproteobacteria bacterium]